MAAALGDEPARADEALGERLAVAAPGPPGLGHAGDEEHLVVHAQAEHDGEGQDRHRREDPARRPGEPEPGRAVALLEHEHQRAEGGAHGQQVERHRLQRHEQRAEAGEQGEQGPADHQGDDEGQPARDGVLVVGVEGGQAPDPEAVPGGR